MHVYCVGLYNTYNSHMAVQGVPMLFVHNLSPNEIIKKFIKCVQRFSAACQINIVVYFGCYFLIAS